MRIYIWHGYLLSGTGSNEYARALTRTLAQLGNDVTVFCQDPDPDGYQLAGAKVVVPELPGPLPVFVLDDYAGAEPRLLTELPRDVVDDFVASNVAAIRAAGPADLLLTNHLLLGGPVGRDSGLRYVVKAHGSELEYAMRGRPDLCEWARQTLGPAAAVIVGSHHIGEVVAELVGVPEEKVLDIPPGVNIEQMRPLGREEALTGLLAECAADVANPPAHADERLPDQGNADRLREFFGSLAPGERPVSYVGKLSHEKGVDLLVAAARDLDLPLVVVGFGPQRAELEEMAGPRTVFTGPLQHRHLSHLWPLMGCSVVPSRFPEAFGMVAAEAASCGCPPLVAEHSGLAEVAANLAGFYPEQLRSLVSFGRGDLADLTGKLERISRAGDADWDAMSRGARAAVVELWSWQSVAHRIEALASDDWRQDRAAGAGAVGRSDAAGRGVPGR